MIVWIDELYVLIIIILQMEELTQIIQQRRRSVLEISKNHEQKHKFQLIQQERKRNDRENWIFRVLKSLKVFSIDQKKVIYDTAIKIMNCYKPIEATLINFQSTNFLQLMINLFVDFFNRFENMDFTHLKSIIRPNNNYIVVDLLKSLIDIGRKQFKIALQEHFKQQISSSSKKLSVKSLMKLPLVNTKLSEQAQSLTHQDAKQGKISLQTKIKYSLLQRYNKVIDNINFDQVYQKANELYFDLLYVNQKNSLKIQKYLDSCFGSKRHINYDATGLYTQQEIKKIIKDQKERTALRQSELKELKGNCSSQHLKQYFKMKVQLYQSISNTPIFTKQPRIREWFPFCLIKEGDKLHPYKLRVQIGANYFSIDQFEQRYGKRIRIYMKELLNEAKGQDYDPALLNKPQYIKFKRQNNIQHNYCKMMELVNEELIFIKKQLMFPLLNNPNDVAAQSKRAKSQSKLPNQSLFIPAVKKSQAIQKQLQKRLNYSSIVKDMNFGSKRKIDTLIQSFLKFTK